MSLFALALVLALIAVWMANAWVNRALRNVDAGFNLQSIVVASKQIGFGQKVEEDAVKTVDWPKANLPSDYFKETKEVVGRVSTQIIYPGDIINKSRVREHMGGSALSALINPNMRAMSVRVNDVVGVSGFLLPDNRVDVLATRTEPGGKDATTHTILEDIKVLAVDQESSREKEKPVVVRSVTLEVDPAQAEILVKATQEGTIQLALRNPGDRSVALKKAEPERPAPVPTARPLTTDVMVIKGMQTMTVQCTEKSCEPKVKATGTP